jgi:hypothetical protein
MAPLPQTQLPETALTIRSISESEVIGAGGLSWPLTKSNGAESDTSDFETTFWQQRHK